MGKDIDWKTIRHDYVTDCNQTYQSLSEKYGVPQSTVMKKGRAEGWRALRLKSSQILDEKIMAAEAQKRARRATKINAIAERLIAKVSQAVDELDVTLARDVTRTKTIEYNNDLRPDKPTKEVTEETEEYSVIHTAINKDGLKAVTSALIDLQKIFGIKSVGDEQEQEARINALKARTPVVNDDEESTGVVELPAVMSPLMEESDG